MELKGTIEPTIGPYEVYEDELFNYKAGVRSVHHRAGRSRVRQAAEVRRRAAGHRRSPADRSEISQPEAGRARADCRRQRGLRRRRRQPRRPDGRLQPAERRARGPRKRLEARDAQERPGRQVRQDAGPDLEGRPVARGSEGRVLRGVLHAHRRPRADARAGAAQHQRRRPADDRAAGNEGGVELLEEAKADISSLFAIQYLIDKGVLPKSLEQSLYTTFLASTFRSIRFGVNEAHGRDRGPAELPARSGRVRESGRRHVRRGPGEGQGGRRLADARHHDHAGGGRLLAKALGDPVRCRAPRRCSAPRSADSRSCGH